MLANTSNQTLNFSEGRYYSVTYYSVAVSASDTAFRHTAAPMQWTSSCIIDVDESKYTILSDSPCSSPSIFQLQSFHLEPIGLAGYLDLY